MSKLYKSYVALKVKDCSKFYLFKSGIFYIFLDEDARTMSSVLGLKLGNLTPSIQKCGFPCSSLEKYMEKLKDTKYKIHIVCDSDFDQSIEAQSFINNQSLKNILENFIATDIDSLSISQAFDLLYNLQKNFKEIIKVTKYEKKR